MHQINRGAAEQHKLAACAHRTAAYHNEKRDEQSGNRKLAQDAHNKTGRIGSL